MQKKSAVVALLLMIWASFLGCASTQSVNEPTAVDKLRSDSAYGIIFSKNFEKHLQIQKESEVTSYLSELLSEMIRLSPEMRESTARVVLIADVEGLWSNYSFPGVRMYLSTSELKATQYESEVVALVALELAHIIKRHALENANKELRPNRDPTQSTNQPVIAAIEPKVQDFFYSEEQWIDAIDQAIETVYKLNFDSRGMLSLLKLMQTNAQRFSVDAAVLQKIIEHTHHAIALYAPLRNPVISSEDYLRVKKRIEKF